MAALDAAGLADQAETVDALSLQASDVAYRGGAVDHLNRSWQPRHRSGDAAIAEAWDLLTARTRDLFRNEAVFKALKRELVTHVVGTGIAAYADVQDPVSGDLDEEFNSESDNLFEQWAEDEASADGKFSWWELQSMHLREVIETGESFLVERAMAEGDRLVPLCYQLLEAEQLDATKDWPKDSDGVKAVRGIEYRRGIPIAYWFFEDHPYDLHAGSGQSVRIPAGQVIHSFLPNRSSENRGVAWFAGGVQPARDLDWYLGNELTAAALGALLTLVIKRKHNPVGSGMGFVGDGGSTVGDSDEHGNPLTKWGRGVVASIGPEDEVTVAESKRPSRDAGPFIRIIQTQLSQTAGVSLLRMTRDYSQSSYTSARGAHLDDQAFFNVLQRWAGRSFVKQPRRRFNAMAVAHGRFRTLGARQFLKDQRHWQRVLLQGPGREQLDPEKETDAAIARIDAGLSTHQHECGLRGVNWRRVAMQRKRELAFFTKHGLSPNTGRNQRQPAEVRKDDDGDQA